MGSSRKKQEVDADVDSLVGPDQGGGIETLCDVVSVSGVNLVREQARMLLLSGPMKDQPSPRKLAFREHEDGLILEKIALRRKMAGILGRCGLRVVGKDVERCLAMCVEERMRGIICNLIRQSKQRVDCEKSWHRHTVSASDVRQEIMTLNKRAREELQAAEARKAKKGNEEGKVSGEGVNGVNEKQGDGDDRMRRSTAAPANVAARAALGGHDITAKWQRKADQLALERHRGKDVNHKAASIVVGRTMNVNVEAEKRGGVEGMVSKAGNDVGKFGRSAEAIIMPNTKLASTRSISVKDVIAVLEKEFQMSKSTLMYLLMNTASQ